MNHSIGRVVMISIVFCIALQGGEVAAPAADERPDYLALVKAYADTMIKHGRDTYGKEHSPLFAEELDRSTFRILEGERLKDVEQAKRSYWGIRPSDRQLSAANPQHCENLYQILYALTKITGREEYAAEADKSLKYFFEHCQSEGTGLFCWGEHSGWNMLTDARNHDTHEFYRPWILWGRSWELAEEPCRRFALGLWQHQIGDQETGLFSRHAKISSHGPDTDAPYARHAGFYMETWGEAYAHTKDDVYLRAITTVLDGLERARLHEGGYVTSGTTKGRHGRGSSDVSLAISLENSAVHVPAELATRMRKVAAANDETFAKEYEARHGPAADAPNAEQFWLNAYGAGGRSSWGSRCMLRYRQTKVAAYRQEILRYAEGFRLNEIDLSKPVWPGTMGNVITLMLDAYELTEDKKYLDAADQYAQKGIELFLGNNPLPKASHVHEHYEAVTNGDTLMMALLRLWLVPNPPDSRIDLTFTER